MKTVNKIIEAAEELARSTGGADRATAVSAWAEGGFVLVRIRFEDFGAPSYDTYMLPTDGPYSR